ncbi:MAG: hypothetical protein LBE82_02130 [Chitinophagaceae bacterium]|jgi:hypothetical protein|nr:hypothetical protein [Chitinophagaceae bacterium]
MTASQELFDEYVKTLDTHLLSETDMFQYESIFAEHHREFGRKLLEQRLSVKDEEKKEYKKNSVRVLGSLKHLPYSNAVQRKAMGLR